MFREGRQCLFTRVVTAVILLLLTIMAAPSSVECSRTLKIETRSSSYYSLFESKLPRGMVPPSDPSPCHHKLGPYHTDDYIICP
ncbi:hypothetical protein LINPERPRIM_LOCUS33845 [Linum perenne]